MTAITKQMWTETGHRLTAYEGKCAHLHGHSYLWEVTVSAPLDERGFVMDFKELKAVMTTHIDEFYDHAFVLHDQDPLVIQFGRDDVHQVLAASNGMNPRLRIVPFNPTAENMAEAVLRNIQATFNQFAVTGGREPTVIVDRVRLWETRSSYADAYPED